MTGLRNMFAYPRQDAVAGVVVFLVALPLCLGIALACGVSPMSGLVAGVLGGLIVPLLSRSPLSVTGPAAGLTSIVLVEVARLGSIERFLAATVVAGAIQFAFGLLRTGRFSTLVPSSVIKGMLASIGIMITLTQLPVCFGTEGSLRSILSGAALGPTIIAGLAIAVLYGWRLTPLGRFPFLSPALVAVLLCSGLAVAFRGVPSLALRPEDFVRVPIGGISELTASLPRPDFASLALPQVWVVGATIAVVASIETLLSLQAVDRLDPLRRHSPPDAELVAQGVANAASGFCGGLPVTAVIVRSGANVAAGGRERMSAFLHGVLLLAAVLAAGAALNLIPLACLAAVLVQVGLGLARPSLFAGQWRLGAMQFMPFAITIAAVLALDLLKGVLIGIVVGTIFVLHQNSKDVVSVTREGNLVRIRFRRDGTFLCRPGLLAALEQARDGESAEIDATGEFIDQDVKEAIAAFCEDAAHRGIRVTVTGVELGAVSGAAH
jgi:MFS superfamily sulfate permease-like transporter